MPGCSTVDVVQKSADLLRVSRHPLGSGSPFPALPSPHWEVWSWGSASAAACTASSVHLLPEVELSSVSWAAAAGAITFNFPVKNIFFQTFCFRTENFRSVKGHLLFENPSAVAFPNQLFFWNSLPHRLKITQTWGLPSCVTKAIVFCWSLWIQLSCAASVSKGQVVKRVPVGLF